MKTFYISAVGFGLVWTLSLQAHPVRPARAQNFATAYYSGHKGAALSKVSMDHAEISSAGDTLYYVFNMNQKDGFVIIAADDAVAPVLGYTVSGHYTDANQSPEFTFWMKRYRKVIEYVKGANIQASGRISSKWQAYADGNARMSGSKGVSGGASVSSYPGAVMPLISTDWNQSPLYNNLCPGGSVTGCVATMMAQIMKYWNYPVVGTGSNTIPSTDNPSYGTLSANFAATTYLWSAMPQSLNGGSTAHQDSAVATLMYDCGVAVDMTYSPSASSANVTTYDAGPGGPCAQIALTKYFAYDSLSIEGLQRDNYTDSMWYSILMNELSNKRPIAYDGFQTTPAEGHTWVCDGYQEDSLFHMNWGWGGAYNAYFAVDALNVDGYAFNSGEEAVVGIQPPYGTQFTASPLTACSSAVVNFKDQSTEPGNITGWSWLFPGGTPSSSSMQNPGISYSSAGFYDVTEVVSSSLGNDTLRKQAYIAVQTPLALPVSEDFEESSFPPAGWYIHNPNNYVFTWQHDNAVGGFGKSDKCMYFDNCDGNANVYGERQQIFSPVCDFSGTVNPRLWFDIAYAPFDAKNSDTLAIYYSLDCGATFTQVYLKGGLTLGTAKSYISGTKTNVTPGGCFLPLAADWRTDTIHLGAIAGQGAVLFSFENRSGFGSNMFIDNVNIKNGASSVSTGVPEVKLQPSLKIYPNPTGDGIFSLSVENGNSGNQMVVITDVIGKEIYSGYFGSIQSPLSLDLSGYPSGIYFVKVISESGVGCEKVVKR